jgi:hypothetical protein
MKKWGDELGEMASLAGLIVIFAVLLVALP